MEGHATLNVFQVNNDASFPYSDAYVFCFGVGYPIGGGFWSYSTISPDSVVPDHCKEGDPVDPYWGYLDFSERDYSVPDRGLSFDFTRHYRSDGVVPLVGYKNNNGSSDTTMWRYPLGQGWTHFYNLFIDPIWQGQIDTLGGGSRVAKMDTVFFNDGQGHHWLYKKQSSDSIYLMPIGCNSQLRRTNSRWTLYQEDGTVCKFNGNGLLDTIDGRNGNKMAFTYDSRNNLTTIRSTSGKSYYLKYYYASADSHRLWKLYETSDTTSGPYWEYKYHKTTVDGVDTLGQGSWGYQLTEVFHHTGGDQDQVELMHRYYYAQGDTNRLHSLRKLTVCVRPDTGYGNAGTSYANGINSGDRLQCWYDSLGRIIYQEEVSGHTNNLISQAFFSYHDPSYKGLPDSTKIYYYKGSSESYGAHSLVDTSFHPTAPTSDYFVKTTKWYGTWLGANNTHKWGVAAWTRTDDSTTGETSQTNYLGYNSNFQPDTVIGPRGDTTFYQFQDFYNLGQGTRYLNLPTWIQYPNKDTVRTFYSSKNKNPVFFQPDSSRDENCYLRKFYYDTLGNDTAVIDTNRVLADSTTSNPQTLRTRFGYTKGNRVKITDPRGTNTYFNYGTGDSSAYLSQTWIDMDNSGGGSPNSNDIVTKYWYNTNRGLLDSMCYYQDYTTGAGAIPIKVRYTYDPLNHLKTVTYPDSAVDSLIYDKRGNMLEKWMRKTGSDYWNTLYSYDAMDHLTRVKERTSNLSILGGGGPPTNYYTTRYDYNLDGTMADFRNAHSDGAVYGTTYSYSLGRLVLVGYSGGLTDSLGYYADGSLLFKRDRNGQVTQYIYDTTGCSTCGRGRLRNKWYYANWDDYYNHTNPPKDSVRYAYDKVGNLVKSVFNGSSGKDSTLFTYDQLYRLKQDSTIGLGRVIKYEYDKNGNRQRMRVMDGSGNVKLYQSYAYWDRANRDSTVAVKIGNTTRTWQMLYYDTGPLKKIIYPSTSTALKEGYTLTPRNFISVVADTFGASTVKFRSIYTYNQVGDRSSDSLLLTKPDASTVQGKITWNYDNIRRLTATRYPKSIISGDSAIYSYDAMGNRLTKVSGGTTATYYYNNNNNELQSDDQGNSWGYDANGNDTIRKSTATTAQDSVFYDYENRLKKVWDKKTYPSVTYDSVRYDYDGLGQRTRKMGLTDTTRYTWDGLYPVVEWNNQGKLKQTFIYANGLLLGIVDSTLATNRRYFVLHDGLGSSIALTDSLAGIKCSLIYSDFGRSLVDTTASNVPSFNRLYAGYPWDGSPANFYWMKYRQTYDAGLGRFGQEDQLLQSGGPGGSYCSKQRVPVMSFATRPIELNLYSYTFNNPIDFVDPAGLQSYWYTDWRIWCTVGIFNYYDAKLHNPMDPLNNRDKLIHCLASCEISKYCYGGSATLPFMLGVAKELQGEFREWLHRKSFGIFPPPPGGGFNIWDMLYNVAGLQCAHDKCGCENCCNGSR